MPPTLKSSKSKSRSPGIVPDKMEIDTDMNDDGKNDDRIESKENSTACQNCSNVAFELAK